MFRSLIVASLVLLPLLGLTWAFGILTVNANATVFAWLFTIFNSLQVGFICLFVQMGWWNIIADHNKGEFSYLLFSVQFIFISQTLLWQIDDLYKTKVNLAQLFYNGSTNLWTTSSTNAIWGFNIKLSTLRLLQTLYKRCDMFWICTKPCNKHPSTLEYNQQMSRSYSWRILDRKSVV